ncbi:SsgA family sporulation/cell division regulator [Streptomyces sp. N2-109]|uniref:SsgA family sporulation/cell division regulator n=1 Tax=Streptomyces gossypii TaxID=2883101 RepID=A0ABT2JTN6_9ACTN|nr:SsgA family sporulation/cell division regulator [Streptomyces gossypii]MCT2591253.1 SsgA family sporulation/cell division regulator [Streptomyces gossypii]
MRTVIESELELRLVLSPERSIAVPSRFIYHTCDPYAVHVAFHIGSGSPVLWTFARELLVEGVFRPCGQGDVRVWPTRVESHGVLCLALSSPDGDALLEVPVPALSAWLESTLRAVPPSREHERLGIDDGLRELLSPTAREAWPSDDSGEPGDAGITP